MAAQWRKGSNNSNKSTVEQRIGHIAGRQLQLITTHQLKEIGLARSSINYRLGNGRLNRIRREIYATHPPPFSREQHWLAATLACGLGALVSHAPAAHLQRMTESLPFDALHVTVPGASGRSRSGIRVHRSPVDPRDVRRVAGVPCTSPDRVLVDLAPELAQSDLELLLVAAESLGTLKRGRLAELVAERAGRPGIPKLTSLLALEPQLTRSELERLFLPIWTLAGLTRPKVDFPVQVPGQAKPLVVDVAWPEQRLAIELDSQRFHGDWESAERDRERDQLLALAGWTCHRFVRRRIAEDPERSATRLPELALARERGLRPAMASPARRGSRG